MQTTKDSRKEPDEFNSIVTIQWGQERKDEDECEAEIKGQMDFRLS